MSAVGRLASASTFGRTAAGSGGFFFQAEDGIRDGTVTGVQTCALPIWAVETEGLRVPGGSQDHYAAALGGALELRFGAAVEARRIPLSPARRAELERR